MFGESLGAQYYKLGWLNVKGQENLIYVFLLYDNFRKL